MCKPESKDFDELGFLSNYILEMEAQQERFKRVMPRNKRKKFLTMT